MSMIYFDHNATTPLAPGVLDAMFPYFTQYQGNATSLHRPGRLASTAVEHAREQIASLCDCHPSEVIFTSGATEANNTVIKGLEFSALDEIIFSPIEHASVLEPILLRQQHVHLIKELKITSDGTIDINQSVKLMTTHAKLICMMLANNETGVIQPLADIIALIRAQSSSLVLIDAVQAMGKIPVSFTALDGDFMSISAHKMGGPKGIGALIAKRQHGLIPLLAGGAQEDYARAGTLNVPAIVGFGYAAMLTQQNLDERQKQLRHLQHYLETQLKRFTAVTIFGENAPRLPNTTFFGLRGFDGAALVMALDKVGVAVSSGSACGQSEPSHVLRAMGIVPELAESAVRISLGLNNTTAEIDQFIEHYSRIINKC